MLEPQHRGVAMFLTIGIILIILWALGLFAFHVTAGFIHILIVLGVIALIYHFVKGSSRQV